MSLETKLTFLSTKMEFDIIHNLRGFQSNFQHRETYQDKIPSTFFQQLCKESFRTLIHLHSWAWERNLTLNMGKICSNFSLYRDLSYYNNCDGNMQLPVSRQFFLQNSRAHSTVKNRLSVQLGFCSILALTVFSTSFKQMEEQQLSCVVITLAFRKSLTGQMETFHGRYSPALEQTGSHWRSI